MPNKKITIYWECGNCAGTGTAESKTDTLTAMIRAARQVMNCCNSPELLLVEGEEAHKKRIERCQ